MFEPEHRESPLLQIDLSRRLTAAGVRLQEIPFQGHLNLRGRPDNPAFLSAVARVLGAELPLQANTFVVTGVVKIYWLGPDEWLIVTPPGQQAALAATLGEALQGVFSSITDVSSGQTLIGITGIHARALLEKGCPIDFHPRVFAPGDCVQTHLAKAAVLISAVDDAPGYELIVRRSFADYLGLWLLDAIAEFSV